MTQIDYIMELFKFLGYESIDEHTSRVHGNSLYYHHGNLIIDVRFNFDTGEITSIGEGVYRGIDGEINNFRGVISEYLKRIPQDKLRDFKLKILNEEL